MTFLHIYHCALMVLPLFFLPAPVGFLPPHSGPLSVFLIVCTPEKDCDILHPITFSCSLFLSLPLDLSLTYYGCMIAVCA